MGKVEPLRPGCRAAGEAPEDAPPRRGEGSWRLRCTINGEALELMVDPEETILETLRERLRLTGTKGACLEGECGSCTILVDGEQLMDANEDPLRTPCTADRMPARLCHVVFEFPDRPDLDALDAGEIDFSTTRQVTARRKSTERRPEGKKE